MGENRRLSDLSEQDFAVLVNSALESRESRQTEVIERTMDEKIEAFRAEHSDHFDFVAWQREKAERRAKLWAKAQATLVGFAVLTVCSGALWVLQKIGSAVLSQMGVTIEIDQ